VQRKSRQAPLFSRTRRGYGGMRKQHRLAFLITRATSISITSRRHGVILMANSSRQVRQTEARAGAYGAYVDKVNITVRV